MSAIRKVALIGNSSVGKTSIASRIVHNHFEAHTTSTIGAAFLRTTIELEDDQVIIEMWDTAGQERYSSLVPMYTRGADAILFVFDLNNRDSLDQIKTHWLKLVESNVTGHCRFYIVGNKSDLCDESNEINETVQEIIQKSNYPMTYFSVSACSGIGITEMTQQIGHDMLEIPEVERRTVRIRDKGSRNYSNESSNCCN